MSSSKKRVTGIGGLFFKSDNPAKLKEWYGKHLGLEISPFGSQFRWIDPDNRNAKEMAHTVWSPFERDTKYFQPSEKEFMVNYRVADLESLIQELKEEGVKVVGEIEVYAYGKFAWIVDLEGNKIELWEPKDEGFYEGS